MRPIPNGANSFPPTKMKPTHDQKDWKDGWKYEFESWRQTIGFVPVEIVASIDESESYEMDRRHVFLCENGSFATVTECGCSCYESGDAIIEFYPTKAEALKAAKIPPAA